MDYENLRRLPKVVLHDHLDGGLRIATILELADEIGYRDLPASDEEGLREWFFQGKSGSLPRYLSAFEHTIAVMETATAVERVSYEAVVDLAAEGVVYAEIRFAPSLVLNRGLKREDVIESALAGFSRGTRETGTIAGLIVDAMRQEDDSEEVARAATRFSGQGVVGFDLAGPEAGYPADAHLPACRIAREAGLGLTIHAGEADGPNSIWRALARCGAQRLGHGVHIVDDTEMVDGEIKAVGELARVVRDHRIPLEVCPTSNLHTRFVERPADHPLGALYRAGFTVTLNTDNRLMSGITLTDEFAFALEYQGMCREDLRIMTVTALEAGFGDWPTRRRIITEVVDPAY